MTRLPSEQELKELPRRAIVYLAAECLAQIEESYRLPEELTEREFYRNCLSSISASGRKFAAGEELDPHQAPGMAAASVISGLKSSSFGDARQQQAAADCAGAARLVALTIARAKSEGARAADDAARYAAEAIALAAAAAQAANLVGADDFASRVGAACDLLRRAGLGQGGELGRPMTALEFGRLMHRREAGEP